MVRKLQSMIGWTWEVENATLNFRSLIVCERMQMEMVEEQSTTLMADTDTNEWCKRKRLFRMVSRAD